MYNNKINEREDSENPSFVQAEKGLIFVFLIFKSLYLLYFKATIRKQQTTQLTAHAVNHRIIMGKTLLCVE